MTPLTHSQARAQLHAAADHRLEAGDRTALDVHLAACAECRAYAAELRALEAALPRALATRLDAVTAPAHLAARVQSRLKGYTMTNRLYNAATFAIGASALVVVALVFAWALDRNRLTPAQEVAAPPLAPSPDFTQQPLTHLVEAHFEGVGALSSYSVYPPGDATLVVTLLWRDLTPPDGAALNVFVQLEDSSGQLRAQTDALLTTDASGGWDYGAYFATRHSLALPADLQPGEYRLSAGIYDTTTGQRVPATDDSGAGIDRVPLGTLPWPFPTPTPLPPPETPTPCQIGCPDISATPEATSTPWLIPTAIGTIPDSPTPFPTFTETQALLQTYVVQAGDTCLSIAAAFNLSVESLIAENSDLVGADCGGLTIGATLRIPAPASIAPDSSATPPPWPTFTDTPLPPPAPTECQGDCPAPTATPLPPPFTPAASYTPCQIGCPDLSATPEPTYTSTP